ncbi:MAG: sporulation protein YunB [Clostridia bacterium]
MKYYNTNYCEHYYKIKKKRRFKRLWPIIFPIIALITFYLYRYIFPETSKTIVAYCDAQMGSLSAIAINDAMMSLFEQSVKFSDFVTIEKDNNGKITLVQANTTAINVLARKVTKQIEKNLEFLASGGIDIPLGTLTNWPMFTGAGPNFKVEIMPNESVICNFVSVFEQAGINQTLHKIYLSIETNIIIIMPTSNQEVNNTSQVLICETIILGDVPEVYLGSIKLGN